MLMNHWYVENEQSHTWSAIYNIFPVFENNKVWLEFMIWLKLNSNSLFNNKLSGNMQADFYVQSNC